MFLYKVGKQFAQSEKNEKVDVMQIPLADE